MIDWKAVALVIFGLVWGRIEYGIGIDKKQSRYEEQLQICKEYKKKYFALKDFLEDSRIVDEEWLNEH